MCVGRREQTSGSTVDLGGRRCLVEAIDGGLGVLRPADYGFVVESSQRGQDLDAAGGGQEPGRPSECICRSRHAHAATCACRARSLPERQVGEHPRDPPVRRRRPADHEPRIEAGTATPAAFDFDDSAWRHLDVPHDWGIEGPFRDDLPSDTGKLPWKGIGWYRKHFNVPAGDQGKRSSSTSTARWPTPRSGSTASTSAAGPMAISRSALELTPYLKFGADNVLAVRLDTVALGLALVSRRGASTATSGW